MFALMYVQLAVQLTDFGNATVIVEVTGFTHYWSHTNEELTFRYYDILLVFLDEWKW